MRDWTATAVGQGDAGQAGASSNTRVVRGGAWNLPANICRSANRFWLGPGFALPYVGFRLARTPGR